MESVYEQFFFLKYSGGWSFSEAYNLPIGLRAWFTQRLIKQLEMVKGKQTNHELDCENLVATIDDTNVDKILICARRTSQITGIISETDFCTQLKYRGFEWMYITSKTGAVINGKKVDRETFFDTLTQYGKEDGKRFVVIHHSILSEGINVPGLEAALFLRNMNFITISQTIGRVIRKGNEQKQFGLVVVPVYDRVGISTSKKVQAVVNTIFDEGQPAIAH